MARNKHLEMLDSKQKSMSIAYSTRERFYYKRQASRLKKELEKEHEEEKEKEKEVIPCLQQ